MTVEVVLVLCQVLRDFGHAAGVEGLVVVRDGVSGGGVEGLEILHRRRGAGEGLVDGAERAREVRGVGGEEGAAGDEFVADLGEWGWLAMIVVCTVNTGFDS